MDKERRRSRRITIDVDVDFGREDTFLFTHTMDVSADGIFVHSNNPYLPGTRLTLRFRLPGDSEPTVAEGEVIWTSPPSPDDATTLRPGMGVKFIDPDDTVRKRLMALIEDDA